MIRVRLPGAEVRHLEWPSRQADDRKLRGRLQMVLLAHRGRRHPDIAADTGTSRRPVRRWLNAYLDRGLGGLTPGKAKGRPPS